MAVKKTTKTTGVTKAKTTKKVTTPKKPDVFASPVTGMVYETTILMKREPVSKDIEVAKVSFHGSTGDVSLITLEPSSEARIESLIEGDMFIKGPPVILVSKAETPFEWIKAFPKATLGRNLYASSLITYYENQ
jgi:hypothetical protein